MTSLDEPSGGDLPPTGVLPQDLSVAAASDEMTRAALIWEHSLGYPPGPLADPQEYAGDLLGGLAHVRDGDCATALGSAALTRLWLAPAAVLVAMMQGAPVIASRWPPQARTLPGQVGGADALPALHPCPCTTQAPFALAGSYQLRGMRTAAAAQTATRLIRAVADGSSDATVVDALAALDEVDALKAEQDASDEHLPTRALDERLRFIEGQLEKVLEVACAVAHAPAREAGWVDTLAADLVRHGGDRYVPVPVEHVLRAVNALPWPGQFTAGQGRAVWRECHVAGKPAVAVNATVQTLLAAHPTLGGAGVALTRSASLGCEAGVLSIVRSAAEQPDQLVVLRSWQVACGSEVLRRLVGGILARYPRLRLPIDADDATGTLMPATPAAPLAVRVPALAVWALRGALGASLTTDPPAGELPAAVLFGALPADPSLDWETVAQVAWDLWRHNPRPRWGYDSRPELSVPAEALETALATQL